MQKKIYCLLYSLMLFFCEHTYIFAVTAGSLDPSFNSSGLFPGIPGDESIPLSFFGGTSGDSAVAYALQIESDGKLVLAGSSVISSRQSMSIVRLFHQENSIAHLMEQVL